MNTVTEWMIDDSEDADERVLTPMMMENLEVDKLVIIVGSWLISVVNRYHGAQVKAYRNRMGGSNAVSYMVQHDGETVGALTVNGPGARFV